MIWQTCDLGDTILKAVEAVRLWETEKGIMEIGNGTLAVPLMLEGHAKGYVFHGHGRLVLDMIVETDEGAIGKPVEKEVDRPFLMLGNTETTRNCFCLAGQEDLSKIGYANRQEFLAKAEDLLHMFSKNRQIVDWGYSNDGNGLIFAFQNQANKLDILLVKDAKLVYNAMGTVFVLDKDRAILKNLGGTVCISNGRSVILKK